MLAPALLVFILLRIPSFFEPRWYTDEAGYLSTAQAAMRGAVLYSQTWTNKPPIQIWLVAVPLRLFGPSEAGLHALTFLSGLLALAAVAWGARAVLSPTRAFLATLAYAVAVGSPAFDAQIAVPESLLLAPVTWAGAILVAGVTRPDRPSSWWWRWGWTLTAGGLTGLALGIQQTCLADAGAFALILLLGSDHRWRDLGLFAAAGLGVTAAWLAPTVALAGTSPVYSSLVGFYRDYASFSAPPSTSARLLRAVGPLLAVVGAVLSRRRPGPTWALCLWATAVLAVAAAANRDYPHFLSPALAPGLLAVASLPGPRRARLRLLPLAAGLAVTSFFASVAWIESKAIDAYINWPAA
ncbi:MAG: ArnT family glycosyltransferase, partial [Candidatus Dormibacterales bacterium]